MADNDYRTRIYANYVQAREQPLAPVTLAGLAPRAPYLRKLIRDHFPADRNAAIMDLGCGHGALIHFSREVGYYNACGVDGSAEQVESARLLGIEGVHKGDVMDTLHDTPSGSQEAVLAFDLIEHFTKPELILLIDEVNRVLKPGGRWIIHAPNAEGPFGGRIRYGDFTHELAFTRTSLDQLLRTSGFAHVNCFEDRPVPHGPKSLVRAGLWLVIRARLLFYIAVETGAFDRQAAFSQNLLAVAIKASQQEVVRSETVATLDG